MLDDFRAGSAVGRRRLGLSLVLSIAVFGGITTAVVGASATVRRVMAEEELVQVEFAPPPVPVDPPPPPPPPPEVSVPQEPRPPARLGQPRPRLEQPTAIPDAPPPVRDSVHAPPADPFAPELEGDPNGAPGGTGRSGTSAPAVAAAPPPSEPTPRPRGPVRVIEGTQPPQFDREEIARNFDIPPTVQSSGLARITVVVRVTVGEDGAISRVEVLRGHPLLPNDNIIRAVERSHASPARMADGSPYAVVHTLPITVAITL